MAIYANVRRMRLRDGLSITVIQGMPANTLTILRNRRELTDFVLAVGRLLYQSHGTG